MNEVDQTKGDRGDIQDWHDDERQCQPPENTSSNFY
jgi:hypothetical protein